MLLWLKGLLTIHTLVIFTNFLKSFVAEGPSCLSVEKERDKEESDDEAEEEKASDEAAENEEPKVKDVGEDEHAGKEKHQQKKKTVKETYLVHEELSNYPYVVQQLKEYDGMTLVHVTQLTDEPEKEEDYSVEETGRGANTNTQHQKNRRKVVFSSLFSFALSKGIEGNRKTLSVIKYRSRNQIESHFIFSFVL